MKRARLSIEKAKKTLENAELAARRCRNLRDRIFDNSVIVCRWFSKVFPGCIWAIYNGKMTVVLPGVEHVRWRVKKVENTKQIGLWPLLCNDNNTKTSLALTQSHFDACAKFFHDAEQRGVFDKLRTYSGKSNILAFLLCDLCYDDELPEASRFVKDLFRRIKCEDLL